MLNERPATPRPIAPARARRKSLKVPASGSVADSNGSPPPPYVRQGADAGSRIEDLLGSPLSMTSQMVEYFNNGRSPGGVGSPAPESWVDEQSQGELRNLLVRAEETISERENGELKNMQHMPLRSYLAARAQLDLQCVQGALPGEQALEGQASNFDCSSTFLPCVVTCRIPSRFRPSARAVAIYLLSHAT
jgi:hypothetical protein